MEPVDIGLDRYSGAMIQNHQYDGLWVVQNGIPEGARLFPNALQVLNRDGYVALGASEGWLSVPGLTDIRGPWSRLHFFDQAVGTIPYFGWRSQMRNGTLMTGNSDLAYMGHWYDQGTSGSGTPVDDNSKVVFGVAENALPAGLTHHQDHFSFRFFSDLGSTADGAANTLEGMEMLRIRPYRAAAEDPVEGFVGVGDFLSAATGPTERFDVLDGNVRIRELPSTADATSLSKYMVVDANGVVHWRTLPTSLANCEWTRNPTSKYVLSGWLGGSTNGTCPDRAWLYGIGKAGPTYKLDIEHSEADRTGQLGGINMRYYVNATTTGSVYGMRAMLDPVVALGTYSYGFGMHATVTGPSVLGVGTQGQVLVNSPSSSGTNATGVVGRVIHSAGTMNLARGVDADVTSAGTVSDSRGVSGNALGGGTIANNYGVYGRSYLTTGTAQNAYGLFGTSYTIAGMGGITNSYGLRANSSGPTPALITNSYGVYTSGNNGATANYGIYATTSGTTALSFAGYFLGNVHIAGIATCTAMAWGSDASLKTDIEELTGARALLAQVRPRNYHFRTEELPLMNLPTGLQRGVIAQELEEVMPELVKEITLAPVLDEDGAELEPSRTIKGVNYVGLIPVLIGAAQEQQVALC